MVRMGRKKGVNRGNDNSNFCGWTGSDFDVCKAYKLERFCLVT